MAKIEVTSYGTDYITVKVSELSTTAKHIEFYIDGVNDKYYALSGTSKSHTYDGLSSGTSYTLSALVYDSNWNKLTFSQNSVTQSTKAAATITIVYHDAGSSKTDSGSTLTIRSPWVERTGWTFDGWATTIETTSVSSEYREGSSVSAGTSNKTVDLYAVYSKSSTIYCYFINGDTGSLDSNTREKKQYRVNVSNTSHSTDYYNTITLPNFSSANSTITTKTPDRDWDARGWRNDTKTSDKTYSGGQSVAGNLISGNFYAVYRNECSITYNSNGGSGSMGVDSGYAYYNASGDYSTPSFNIDECTFTPPSGKRFSHWNQKADGSGTTYEAGSSQSTNYNVIFYAIWITGRPSNWAWTTNVSKGVAMAYSGSGTNIVVKPLTAKEWLNFTERIKEFYTYKGKTVDSDYWYRARNGVSSGQNMTRTQANAVRYLISQLSPPTSVPAKIPDEGTVAITAAFINGLKNSLNSID